nr:hypothetical protein JVH1_7515 [Rhodococcus sp. JVH1]
MKRNSALGVCWSWRLLANRTYLRLRPLIALASTDRPRECCVPAAYRAVPHHCTPITRR